MINGIFGKVGANLPLTAPELDSWLSNVLPEFTDANFIVGSAFSDVQQILNLNPDGTPLTRTKALQGPAKDIWVAAGIKELCKLFDTCTLVGAHLRDTNGKTPTYYNPVLKEKYKYDGPNGEARRSMRTSRKKICRR